MSFRSDIRAMIWQAGSALPSAAFVLDGLLLLSAP